MSKKMPRNVVFLIFATALLAACGVPVGPTAVPSPTVTSDVTGSIGLSPTVLPPPTATTCVPGSIAFPTTLRPTDVLVQFDWEGGFTRWEASISLGRVPVFTLLADGRAFYVAGSEQPDAVAAQTMVAHLTSSEAHALVQHVLDLGFECLASYTDDRWQLADGTVERVVDAGTSVLRVRLPNGKLREIRNYADFANDRQALQAIRTFLDAYQHPQAEPYTPEKATLFVQSASAPSGVAVLHWPLDPAWLDPPQPGAVPWTALLTGSDVETLLAATGLNMGGFWFRDADRVFAVYLVPQIPGVEYAGGYVTVSGQRLAVEESSGATEIPTPVPSCLQAGSTSRLIVEEHPLKTRPIPAEAIPASGPGFSAYFQTAKGDMGQILGMNQALRDVYALILASNNALLEPFGYRLALKKCGDVGSEWYTLYHGEAVYQDPVYGLSLVSVNASGTDFVLPLDLADGPFFLTGDGLARRDPADYLPVHVDDELLTARVLDAIEIYLGERLVYRDLVPPGPVPALVPSSPWSYDEHWIVEQMERIQGTSDVTLRGHIIQDGQDLNQTCGYEESFGFALLDGRPFYFVKRDGKIDIAYDGQQVPMGYELVPHYRCCSVAALNPSTSQNMVWFFATRDYRWYYVEAYVPPVERPSLIACPTPTPGLVPTPKHLPAPAALPGTPQPGAVWLRAKDSTDWKRIRYIPGGPFYMGSPEGLGRESERPLHVVTLDPFWIDETEVTHGNYQICVEAGACDAQDVNGYDPLGRGAEPIEVTWDVAQAYCRWANGRMPTEAEWEKAARGSDAHTYPWGDDHPDCSRANYESLRGYCFNGLALAGSFPAGASPYGVMDMAGNVAEWVNDWYDPGYYAASPEQNPQGPDSGQGRVVRGGAWYDTYPYIRAAYRDAHDPDGATAGFRCVVPAPTFTIVESDLYDGWYQYTNLDYGFSFHYPPEWTLEDKPHLVTLQHKADDTLQLGIGYRWASEEIGHWRTGMPAGDFVPKGSVPCLGQEISRDVLVYEGKDKMALYNYSSAIPWGDIVFGFVLEDEQDDYETVDLPQDVQRQIDQVVASLELQE
jgi:sulfatase modifying factor 1